VRRSLLDGVALGAVRAAAGDGPYGIALACLLDAGVVQHDPADPTWADRDRVLAGRWAQPCADAAFARYGGGPPEPEVRGRPVLPVGLGAALASGLDGGIFRVWCLLGPDDADGATWEAARAAIDARAGALAVVARDPRGELGGLLATAGWALRRVDLDAPAEVLGALDHVLAGSDVPTAVTGR
jgi:hypothetical protein